MAVVASGIGACSSASVMRVNVVEDASNSGNSVVVRIYELNDRKAFDEAFVDSFWLDDEETLGPTLIRKHEIILLPNAQEDLTLELSERAMFLAAAANFRTVTGDGWKSVLPVPSNRKGNIRITVRAGRVEITPA